MSLTLLTKHVDSQDLRVLVQSLVEQKPGSIHDLYTCFARRCRLFFLGRSVSQTDVEDLVHDTLLAVVQQIAAGQLRESEALPGYVQLIARNKYCQWLQEQTKARRECGIGHDLKRSGHLRDNMLNPEEARQRQEQATLVRRALETMSPQDREVLTRFYLQEQTKEEIQIAMGLTATQFRLLKSRAKAKFGAIGRNLLVLPRPSACPEREKIAA